MSKDSIRVSVVGGVILVVAFLFTFQFVEPAPPREITIATGGANGAYFAFAQRYRTALARQGITLKVLPTAGSIDNIALLSNAKADVAFVQGGTGDAAKNPGLVSLGSLYFEPLWVFVQAPLKPQTVADLGGLKISAGAQGSGTWAVARRILMLNRINTDTARVQNLSSRGAADGLISGTLDAAFFVASPTSPVVRDLLQRPGLRLLTFTRAEAYTRRLRYLSAVTLPQGGIDLGRNLPAQDTVLLAPAATLVTRADLHPALQTLMVQAAREIHGPGGLFATPGQFPSAQFLDFPLSDDARRYLQNGPSFLERYLPFWAAVLVDRLKVLLIPLITLLIPLAKVLPLAYRWRVRSRIFRWYKELIRIEQAIVRTQDPVVRHKLLAELAKIADHIRDVQVPMSYADELYSLRRHAQMVLQRLTEPGP